MTQFPNHIIFPNVYRASLTKSGFYFKIKYKNYEIYYHYNCLIPVKLKVIKQILSGFKNICLCDIYILTDTTQWRILEGGGTDSLLN